MAFSLRFTLLWNTVGASWIKDKEIKGNVKETRDTAMLLFWCAGATVHPGSEMSGNVYRVWCAVQFSNGIFKLINIRLEEMINSNNALWSCNEWFMALMNYGPFFFPINNFHRSCKACAVMKTCTLQVVTGSLGMNLRWLLLSPQFRFGTLLQRVLWSKLSERQHGERAKEGESECARERERERERIGETPTLPNISRALR